MSEQLDTHTEASNISVTEGKEDYTKFERLPTTEEIIMLDLANDIATEEIAKLGLDSTKIQRAFPFPVQPSRLRIALPGHPKLENSIGHMEMVNGNVLISGLDEEFGEGTLSPGARKLVQFRIMLHEIIHAAGFSKKNRGGKTVRTGYGIYDVKYKEYTHEHLRGFNEGVVERLTQEWFVKHRAHIKETLGAEDADFLHPMITDGDSYQTEQRIVHTICSRISNTERIGTEIIWDRIARGHFSGDLLRLNMIEKAFGKGSLRLLASVRSTDVPAGFGRREENIAYHTEGIEKFLNSSAILDEHEKKSIASKYLDEAEYFLFLRRRYQRIIDDTIIMAADTKGPIAADSPQAKTINAAFYHADNMAGSVHRLLRDIQERAKEKMPIKYSAATFANLARYADIRREALRLECKRLKIL